MRRVIFIILWTVAFAVLTLLAGCVGFALLGHVKMESWSQSAVVRLGMGWSVIFFGVPTVGLILGLLGKLPGTKRRKS